MRIMHFSNEAHSVHWIYVHNIYPMWVANSIAQKKNIRENFNQLYEVSFYLRTSSKDLKCVFKL